MKKLVGFGALFFLLFIPLSLYSWIIITPTVGECETIEITVTEIKEGTSKDIVLKDSGTDFFYINRGIEQGLTVLELREQVVGEKVTLHLPKLLFGIIQSEHIAQLTVRDSVIFTEFN